MFLSISHLFTSIFNKHRLDKHKNSVGVPTEFIDAAGVEVPWLDPYKMVQWLAAEEKLDLLHGKVDLLEFWRRFALVQSHHPIFSQDLPLSRVIPFLSHGDEGRTKKKKGILIWSMKGICGIGTRFFRDLPEATQRQKMGLNVGNSLTSRFLHIAVPCKLYKHNENVWHALASRIGHAYWKLAHEGFEYNGQTWYACCVGLTGDAPYLSKAGCLERNYARVSKTTGARAKAGICFECMAGSSDGTTEIPFEDLSFKPKWRETESWAPLPWKRDPPFLTALQDLRPEMLQYDSQLKDVLLEARCACSLSQLLFFQQELLC